MPRRLPGILLPSRAVIRSAPPSRLRGAVWCALGMLAAALLLPVLLRPPAFRDDPDFATRPPYRAAMALAGAGQYLQAAGAFGSLAERERNSTVGGWARYQEAICYRATAGAGGQGAGLAGKGAPGPAQLSAKARAAFRRVMDEYPQLHLASLSREALDELSGGKDEPRPTGPALDPLCGPKCLLHVCRARGIRATLPELARRCRTGATADRSAPVSWRRRTPCLRPRTGAPASSRSSSRPPSSTGQASHRMMCIKTTCL